MTNYLLDVLKLVLIDLVLSGDNAVVIAMAVKDLPPAIARKAALWGAAGAVGLRILFAALASMLLGVPLLQAAGGAVLFWIAYKLLAEEEEGESDEAEILGFFHAVRTIVLADVVMSLDNILAVGGASHGHLDLLVIGLAISIPLVLWGSSLLTKVLRRFPLLSYAGAGVLAWTAGSMIVHDSMIRPYFASVPGWAHDVGIPMIGVAIVLFLGWRAQKAHADGEEPAVVE